MYYHTDQYSLYYEKFGNGDKTILILPGWGNTRTTFYNMTQYFKEDYTVYIIDYPGFGNSPWLEKDISIYDYATMIMDFMIALNIKEPIVIGHSFGGRIAILLDGCFHVKLEKIVLIDSAGIKPKRKLRSIIRSKTYKFLKKLISFLPKKKRQTYLQKLQNKFASVDYKSLTPGMHTTFRNVVNEDLKQYLTHISSEVLLLWGQLDTDTPIEDGSTMNKLIKESALIIFPYGNHFCYLQYKDVTNQIIEEFIKE